MSDAIILGAGPAGLSCAAMLKEAGLSVRILEKDTTVCPVWHRHYDRLHLHTDRGHSGLPGLRMPRSFPRYPSRAQVIDYCEDYARHFDLKPKFECRVNRISYSDRWHVDTSDGMLAADVVVVALGLASFPHRPTWPGLDTFSGTVMHSADYHNREQIGDQRVLIVGYGNSGAEIALDLARADDPPRVSVRGPVNIVPKEVLGIPILSLTIAEQVLPYRLADVLNRWVVRLALGNTRRLGFPAAGKGPLAQVIEDGKSPVLDVGTLDALRSGTVLLRGGIAAIDGPVVRFADGMAEEFDIIIQATGFRPDLRRLLPDHPHLLTPDGMPRSSGAASGEHGLFFCSYRASPTGQLREIGIEARQIADAARSVEPAHGLPASVSGTGRHPAA